MKKGVEMARKPRLQVAIEPEVDVLLKEMSEMTGESVSGLVADLLLSLAPALEQSLDAMKMAKNLEQEARDRVAQRLEEMAQIMEEETARNIEKAKKITH